MQIDIAEDETGWTITGQGEATPHTYRANVPRCGCTRTKRRRDMCTGFHEGDVIALVRALRKTYSPTEGLFRCEKME